jgi:hypothetical protein
VLRGDFVTPIGTPPDALLPKSLSHMPLNRSFPIAVGLFTPVLAGPTGDRRLSFQQLGAK